MFISRAKGLNPGRWNWKTACVWKREIHRYKILCWQM